MEKTTFINWLQSKRGRSRWELQYEATALQLDNNNILTADVYDDYLFFNVINGKQLDEYKTIYTILIDDYNAADVSKFAYLETKANEIKF